MLCHSAVSFIFGSIKQSYYVNECHYTFVTSSNRETILIAFRFRHRRCLKLMEVPQGGTTLVFPAPCQPQATLSKKLLKSKLFPSKTPFMRYPNPMQSWFFLVIVETGLGCAHTLRLFGYSKLFEKQISRLKTFQNFWYCSCKWIIDKINFTIIQGLPLNKFSQSCVRLLCSSKDNCIILYENPISENKLVSL